MNEVFAEYFSSIFNSVKTEASFEHQKTVARMNLLLISFDDVCSVSSELNESIIPGGDGVQHKDLKSCASRLVYPLTLIFEKCLRPSVRPYL